ncbi:MAG: TIGR03564 family F420-dependent LLM class oxidoreductase [Chloroflexi bacterium]|nr:TIGR03564 family F420-dependent LLM class oxidoreductase [Chloroflexota bacterium]
MRIGLNFGGTGKGLADLLARFVQAETDGYHTAWTSSAGYDPLMLLALVGHQTKTIELGTAVVPTFPRHPVALAQQALTVQAASGNRFTLGIGLSHRVSMEERLGIDFSKPVRHMREYLSVLNGVLTGQPTQFSGQVYRVNTQLAVPNVKAPSVIVAALGEQMLKLAGRMADGTITWMGGPKYLATVAIPVITKAAREAGRPAPRIVAGFPVAVTNHPEAAKAAVAQTYANYANLPSYRHILEIEGAADVTLAAVIGDETQVEAQLKRLADSGVTDFNASLFGVKEDPGTAGRTHGFLGSLAKAGIK